MRRALLLFAAVALQVGTAIAAASGEDPFLWLEERKSPKALAWVEAHNALTEKALKDNPLFSPLLTQTMAIAAANDSIPFASFTHGRIENIWTDESHVQGVWRSTTVESYRSADPQWETILDFDKLAADEGVNWIYKGGNCLQPKRERCLIALSPNGGDAVEYREFDRPSQSFVEDGFALPLGKSSMGWIGPDAVLVATDFGAGSLTQSGYTRIVKLWQRGTPLASAKTVFEGKPEDTSVDPAVYLTDQGYLPAISRSVDFFNAETYLLSPDGTTTMLPLPLDAEINDFFKGQIVFRVKSDWAAPDGATYPAGSLLAFSFDDWRSTGKVGKIAVLFAPAGRTAFNGEASTKDTVFLSVLDNVRSRILAMQFENGAWTAPAPLKLPENGNAWIADSDMYSAVVMFGYEDFLTPTKLVWSFDDAKTLETVKSLPARFDASPYQVKQYEAKSADGTMVPYFWIGPKDIKGPVPTMLYGYGGFEDMETPFYWASAGRLWLTRGNAFVIANIRGGGEFGPAWHEAALKQNRQRAYDDFEGIAEDLIARTLTTPRQLGIVGGSNGGLLVGVAFTQRPDLFNAVVCDVPLLDMLRYTELPPGASWVAEYGDPAVPEERAALLKYSPYQNLKDGTVYPRVYFHTSTADDRVHPGHARKMAALMESKGYPFLFYEETEGGHGGSDVVALANQLALQYVYLITQLEAPPPAPGAN